MNPALVACRKQITNLIQQQPGWHYRGLNNFIEIMPNRLLDKPPVGISLRHNELLKLQFEFRGTYPIFKTIIMPGDGSQRHNTIKANLSNRLSAIPGAKTPQGSKYLVHFLIPIDCADLKNSFNKVIRIVNAI